MPPLKVRQVHEAIAQVISDCKRKMDAYNAGTGDYESASLRQELYDLGYNADAADQIIEYCFEEGFTYCIDTNYPSNGEPTPYFATVWGVDQLKSRLDFIAPYGYRS